MLQNVEEEWMVVKESKFQRDKVIVVKQERIGLPLNGGKSDCGSLTRSEIYISAQWAVVPCCFLGNSMFYKESDNYWKDITDLAEEYSVNVFDLIATDERSVSSIVNRGFDWIYESLSTTKALSICYRNCNSKTAPFAVGQTHKNTKIL
jgi:hypothetical protein